MLTSDKWKISVGVMIVLFGAVFLWLAGELLPRQAYMAGMIVGALAAFASLAFAREE